MYKVCRDFILNLKKNLEIIVKLIKKKYQNIIKIIIKITKIKFVKSKQITIKRIKIKFQKKEKKFNAQICYDPKKEDFCTFGALQSRKKRNKELYKDINLKNCIIKS